jgi:2-amino-4-hydroxy-6-hydroxymethyldihydropteridine diphosphokinase
MNKAYILIGGNVGDVMTSVERAIQLLNKECGNVVKVSSLYQTAPWGKTDQQNFLNQALLIETHFKAPDLMHHILQIEERLGRQRIEKYGPRIIDIDILLFNNAVIREAGLTIPHPSLHLRRFALVPLVEIAPDMVHPVFQSTIKELLLNCPDDLAVTRIG